MTSLRDTSRRIDVLIPHYNDPSGLKLSLDSVAAQTWSGSFRIVVVDDGSAPDEYAGMRSIIDRYDGQVELISSPTNRGRPYARNVLLDGIESRHVAWLDAGDEWYPGKIDAQYAAFGHAADDAFTWVSSDYDWQWLGRRRRTMIQNVDQDQLGGLLVGRTLRAYLWTVLAPASSFKGVGYFDPALPRLQDLDYFIRFVSSGGRIAKPTISGPLCVYHKSDIGRDARQVRACAAYLLEKHRMTYDSYGAAFVRDRVFDMDLLAARFAVNNGDIGSAFRYFVAAAKRPLLLSTRLARAARSRLIKGA